MTSPFENNSPSFFQTQATTPSNTDLISDQLDPTLPSVTALSTITDPLLPVQHSSLRYSNFDPDLYDLKDGSQLIRLLNALTGAAGTGGLRKQLTVNRMSNSLASTNFSDVDAFYGPLFNVYRMPPEQMPTNDDGSVVNPMTDTASDDVWDQVAAADARYKSKIIQLARGIAMGATYPGLKLVAEALTGSEVDIYESWVKADVLSAGTTITPTASGQTYGTMKTTPYGTWGSLEGISYAFLEGNAFGEGATPTGNRGEIVFDIKRVLTEDEKYQLYQVLRVLRPSHTQVTLGDEDIQSYNMVPAASLDADSESWSIATTITPSEESLALGQEIYPHLNGDTSARPVFSQYVGESWSYNPSIVSVLTYRTVNDVIITNNTDEMHIIFSDGQTRTYAGEDGLIDAHQVVAGRLASDGVMAAYPYSGSR